MHDDVYEAKTVLENYRVLKERIKDKEFRLEELHEKAKKSTSNYEAVRVSGTMDKSRVETAMISAMDLEAQMKKSIDQLYAKQYEIERVVDLMEGQEARILELRFIDGLKWETVMEKMYISETTSKRIVRNALKIFHDLADFSIFGKKVGGSEDRT